MRKILIEKNSFGTIIKTKNNENENYRIFCYNEPTNFHLDGGFLRIDSYKDYPKVMFRFEEIEETYGTTDLFEFFEYLVNNNFFSNSNPFENTATLNGEKVYRIISKSTTNIQTVLNKPTKLMSILAIGLTNNVRFLKLYDKSTDPVLATDIPKMIIPIPANTQGAGVAIPYTKGIEFDFGIGVSITANIENDDETNVVENDVVIHLTYLP